MTGEAAYEDAAVSLIRLLHTVAPEHPLAFGHLLRAIDFHLAPVREVALAGDDLGPLARVVRGGFFPHVVLAGGGGAAVPLLEGRVPVDGHAAAYVCERFTCAPPGDDAGGIGRFVAIARCFVTPSRSRCAGCGNPGAHTATQRPRRTRGSPLGRARLGRRRRSPSCVRAA